MESNLMSQRHAQNVAETEYTYGKRSTEMERGHEMDNAMENLRFGHDQERRDHEEYMTMLEDSLMRGRVELSAKAETRQIKLRDMFKIEDYDRELSYTKQKYKAYEEHLKNIYKADPETGTKLTGQTLKGLVDGMAKIGELTDTYLGKIDMMNRELAELNPKDKDYGQSRKVVMDNIGTYQDMLGKMKTFSGVIEHQLTGFSKIGITPDGEVPEDKMEYILQGLDKLRSAGIPVEKLNPNEIVDALRSMGMDISPADARVALANALGSFSRANK
jgi:hypothetical protein